MALLTPLWLQNGEYPARYDRQFVRRAFGAREMVFEGLTVAQNGAGAVSVIVAAGACVIQGDDQSVQGAYLVENDAAITLSMPAVPGSDKRIDVISVRINDPQAGGPAGDNASLVVTQGTASATPAVPATPTSAIAIAQVLRTAGDAAILTSMITDVAPRGLWPYTVSTSAVPATLPSNYLYVRVS